MRRRVDKLGATLLATALLVSVTTPGEANTARKNLGSAVTIGTTNTPLFTTSRDTIAAALIIKPSFVGCDATLTITLSWHRQQSRAALKACGSNGQPPQLDGLLIRREPRSDSSHGTELGLLPKLSHSTYRRTITVRLMEAHHVLFLRTVRLSMYWSPNTRVWQGTDQFINYCIDKGRPVYSSNLRLYCNDPADLLGEVQFNPARTSGSGAQ